MGEADAVLEFPIEGTTLMTFSPRDAFAHYAEHGPESRMELVSNRLLLGGDIRGSLAMLGYILAGWGADAALPLAVEKKWWTTGGD